MSKALVLILTYIALAGTAISSKAGGILEGEVLFEGAVLPRATQIENTTDPQWCGKIQSLENVVISPKGRVKNAIIALKNVPLPATYQPAVSRLILDNTHCRFEPHAAVLTTSSTVEAVNSDPIFHTVHLYGFRNINLALGPKSSKVAYVVRRPGFIIAKCDVHGWMQAFIRVDDHPFHAVTDAGGRFRIEAIPPGVYALEVWHEYFGSQEIQVKVDSEISRVTIRYRSEK